MIVSKTIHIDWCETDLVAEPNGIDIWEKDGNCYFTWEAAMREAEKQGLRLPTKGEWEDSFKIIGEKKLFDFLKLNLSGNRNYSNGQYDYQGSYGYYWSSSPYSSFLAVAYNAYFYSGGGNIANYYCRAYGFSVRCVRK